MRSILISTLILAVAAALGVGQDLPEARLQIERIVLYKHGVGYFERQGEVTGDVTIPLSFKSDEMKDVLKSLFAVDQGGGRISTILYDSKDPLSKQLQDILFTVPEEHALTRFLTQLKGARVEVRVGTETVVGRILGIEPEQRQTPSGTITSHKLVLLVEGGGITPVELSEAAGVTILDETVCADLERMMQIYARSRYADRKVVSLRAEGRGTRKVRVGYLIETPIWKTSYRLLFEEGEEPLLQGWGIVENRTDEDWKDVRLSFVAGSPMSFVMDLYTSYYPKRPVIGMGIAAAAAPPPPPAMSPRNQAGRKDRARRPSARPSEKRREAGRADDSLALGELARQSVEPLTRGVAVGELFAYEATSPVSIRRGQAALVPILTQSLPKSVRILYYDAALSTHPTHACWLENGTDLTLEKGPVTVFEGATCLGEALLARTLKSGDHEILPFALEPGVEVEVRGDRHQRPVTRAIIADGVMTLLRREVKETRYRILNRTGKAHTLYLDHPRSAGAYELVEPKKAVEELAGHLRFKVELPASGESVLAVKEERELGSRIRIDGLDAERIAVLIDEPYLSVEAREFLAGVGGLMRERAGVERGRKGAEEELGRLIRDQKRLRENMGVLRETAKERTIREQYLERLMTADKRIEELHEAIRAAAARKQDLDARLAEMVGSFRQS